MKKASDLANSHLSSLQPIFIVGTPKSGTTFLYSLFDSHPNLISLLETQVYNLSGSSLEQVLKFYEEYWMPASDINPALDLESLKTAIQDAHGRHNHEPVKGTAILQALLSLAAKPESHCTHFVEKTPSHYKRINKIVADFPNAKIIHVIRDPRDNYLSLQRRMQDEKFAHYQSASYHPVIFLRNRLISSLEAACLNASQYPEHYRIVYYEDLILDNEKTLDKILAWIDLPFDDCLRVPQKSGKLWKGNSSDPALRGQMQGIDSRSIGKWQKSLTDREVVVCEWLIWKYQLETKYPLTRCSSWIVRLYSLFLPFKDEVRLELKTIGKWRLIWQNASQLIELIEKYINSRTRIFKHLRTQEKEKVLTLRSF
jgi:hypothetical protein